MSTTTQGSGRHRRHRADRVLEELRPLGAAARRARPCAPRSATRALKPTDVDGMTTLHPRYQRRHRDRARRRNRRPHVLQPHAARRRSGARASCTRPPWRSRPARPRSWSATARSTGAPASATARASRGDIVTSDLIHWSWYMPFGLMTPASWVAMFTQRYMHETGCKSERPRAGRGLDAQARGDESERVLLRQAAHARGAPELADDRRPAAPVRLLPGDGRRLRLHRHHARARARPRAARRADPRHRAGGRAPTRR